MCREMTNVELVFEAELFQLAVDMLNGDVAIVFITFENKFVAIGLIEQFPEFMNCIAHRFVERYATGLTGLLFNYSSLFFIQNVEPCEIQNVSTSTCRTKGEPSI